MSNVELLRNNYPDSTWPSAKLQEWANQQGVALDETGLVIPAAKDITDPKVCNWSEIHTRILEARKKGKHVIILPGGYDVVHIGHLSFVVQAIDSYLESTKDTKSPISRRDLYVVGLADSDGLIRETKRNAYLKATGEDGPVEKGATNDKYHPRIIGLASLPVDAVSLIPSPEDSSLPNPPIFKIKEMQAKFKDSPLWVAKLGIATNIDNALANFPVLVDRLKDQRINSFDYSWWSIELWQLYMLGSLNIEEIAKEKFIAPITRIISQEEEKYLDTVNELMRFAKIKTEVINDVFCISTKELVERYGTRQLLNIKRKFRLN